MGNCISNTGNFEPPGAKAVNAYVAERERYTDPRWQAVRAAELRAQRAESALQNANGPPVPAKPKGPKCSICKCHVDITVNPWQQTRIDLLSLEMSDDDSDAESDTGGIAEVRIERRRSKLKRRGIELKPCQHNFCGACLAQSIYQNLNISFDPSNYGTKLNLKQAAVPNGKVEFPMGCPSCQVKPGEKLIEISDMTARLVLGDGNMDDWNHARFMSTLDIIHCPYKGCNEPFDANDVAAAPHGVTFKQGLVQCPRCKKSLCKDCKVNWHDSRLFYYIQLTCAEYQALPVQERAPEDLAFMALAETEKWRKCPKCGAMVELKHGCNHITCTCKHHFCYLCGGDFEYKDGKYRCSNGKGCKLFGK